MINHLKFLLCMLLIFGLLSCKSRDMDDGTLPTCATEIAGKTVGVISGAIIDVNYDKLFGEGMTRINTAPEVLAACENGVVDYCMMDTIHFIGADAEKRGLVYCFSDTLGGEVGVAFKKTSVELCESFNRWLSKAKSDGTLDEIVQRWTKGDVKNATMPDFGPSPEGKPLNIGVSSCFPFSFLKNNSWTGLEIDMAERWGREIGRPIQIYLYDYNALVAALETDKIDAICSFMYNTPERSKRVLFSDAYYSSHNVCFKHGNRNHSSDYTLSGLKQRFHDNIIEEDRWKILLDGLYETIVISFFAILFGTLIGAFICWMKMSGIVLLEYVATLIIDIVRGIPILVFLMALFYFVLASTPLTARWIAIIAFSINFAAYVSEMFRTGILGVDRGQTEAGLSMGYTKVQTFMRFVVPQAFKNIIPVYKGEMISIIKSTSVVGYIAIQDLTKIADIIRSRTFDAFFPILVISIIYFFLTWLVGKILDVLDRKFDRG